MTGSPLRRRLFLLIAVGILPLAIMAGLGLDALVGQQDTQAERVGLELARSVATAIDGEHRRSIAVLETLATSPTLDREDLAEFRELAGRVIEPRPEWAAILLAAPSGASLVDTRDAQSGILVVVAETDSFERVVRTGTPAVGGLTRHPEHGWLFAVRVPVFRAGRLRYVVSALVRPEAIRNVLTRQAVPSDWVISIIDADGLRVARSRAHEQNLGGRLSETAQQVVARGGEEGFGLSLTLEGDRIYTPFSRLASSRWAAVLGIPTATVEATAGRSLTVYGSGVLLSLALGALGAAWVARSISRPMADLRSAAEAMGRREAPQLPETSIQEIREVGAALTAAAGELSAADVERERLFRQERLAREAAESADRAKEEFLAVLSHELRTPLNAVYGWARLLQADQVRDPALVERAKDAIVRNADAQVRLIDDLLDLSRITSGKMRLDVRLVEMPAVLQGALDAVRPAADARSIAVQTTIDTAVGPVSGDPARLQQVVWNLLMNAVKFTPRGGRVRLELQPADGYARVVVADTGQGIAPDTLPFVFERFRQADSSSTRAHGGLGLGLALVKHLVELHGGSVAAYSAGEGQGATFVVTLPVAPAEIPAGAGPRGQLAVRGAEAPSVVARLDDLRVLVIDDDGDALTLAEAILARAGADVRTCPSAPTALALLRHWRPDVLVSDIEMPDEDGYSLIRKVRALPAEEGGNTPAIALTAYGRPQDRLRALAAGYSMHVPKPVDPGELTTIIAGVAGQPDPPRVPRR